MNKKSIFNNEELLRIIAKDSNTIFELITKFGCTTKSAHYNTVKKYLKLHNIDISHFVWSRKGKFKREIKDVLIKNYKGIGCNKKIKKYLYDSGIKKEECELCGLKPNEWKTGKISLILDHIDGINNNNEITNLRIICPNCDSTLDTYMGRNKNKNPINIENKYKKQSEQIEYKRTKLEQKEIKNKEIIKLIKNSKIDFSKNGWGIKLSEVLDCSANNALNLTKRLLPEFYQEKCFKHKN